MMDLGTGHEHFHQMFCSILSRCHMVTIAMFWKIRSPRGHFVTYVTTYDIPFDTCSRELNGSGE